MSTHCKDKTVVGMSQNHRKKEKKTQPLKFECLRNGDGFQVFVFLTSHIPKSLKSHASFARRKITKLKQHAK